MIYIDSILTLTTLKKGDNMNQSATFINANYYEHKTYKNADGTPARYQRNGKTKLWKRQPDKFQIPVKRGLREYGYIDNDNWKEFNAV